MLCSFLNTLTMTTLSMSVCWMDHGRLDVDFLYHPFKIMLVTKCSSIFRMNLTLIQFSFSSLPWNQNTLLGYFAEIFYVFLNCQTYMFANGTVLIFFLSQCYYLRTFYKMFDYMVTRFNFLHRNHHYDKKYLCDLVYFHFTIREYVNRWISFCNWAIDKNFQNYDFNRWFTESTELYSPYIGVQLLCCMLILAASVFQVDLVRSKNT